MTLRNLLSEIDRDYRVHTSAVPPSLQQCLPSARGGSGGKGRKLNAYDEEPHIKKAAVYGSPFTGRVKTVSIPSSTSRQAFSRSLSQGTHVGCPNGQERWQNEATMPPDLHYGPVQLSKMSYGAQCTTPFPEAKAALKAFVTERLEVYDNTI